MRYVVGFVAFVAEAARGALGVVAAMLPARWWTRLDPHVPASASATLSGVGTLLTAGAIGIPAFLSYAAWTAGHHNDAALTAMLIPELDNEGALRRIPMAFNALALPMFLLLTPEGWATAYLGISGLLRTSAAISGRGFGDPLLTAIDALAVHWRAGVRAASERRRREALEGPAGPDRVVSAAQIGVPDADVVIVASRRKPDWDAGTVVLTGEGAFRVGSIEERMIAGRLRTLYALTEHRDLEVFRRVVHYELPPGRRT